MINAMRIGNKSVTAEMDSFLLYGAFLLNQQLVSCSWSPWDTGSQSHVWSEKNWEIQTRSEMISEWNENWFWYKDQNHLIEKKRLQPTGKKNPFFLYSLNKHGNCCELKNQKCIDMEKWNQERKTKRKEKEVEMLLNYGIWRYLVALPAARSITVTSHFCNKNRIYSFSLVV